MKRQMKLIVTEDPVDIVEIALAKEQHDRRMAFDHLQNQGHVRIMMDHDPALIRVKIEDTILSDERERFPSVQLMARLQLAVNAGQSERHSHDMIDHNLDAMRYGAMQHWQEFQAISRMNRPGSSAPVFWMDEAWTVDEKITAKVMMPEPKRPRRQKGLRP